MFFNSYKASGVFNGQVKAQHQTRAWGNAICSMPFRKQHRLRHSVRSGTLVH